MHAQGKDLLDQLILLIVKVSPTDQLAVHSLVPFHIKPLQSTGCTFPSPAKPSSCPYDSLYSFSQGNIIPSIYVILLLLKKPKNKNKK
jgi:hypothetical protein